MDCRTIEYAAILEEGPSNWSAYVPDLPGCVAAGRSRAEAETLIREAVALHLELMAEDGDAPPPVRTVAVQVAVSAA